MGREINTIDDAIEALGGDAVVREMTGARSASTVSNWKSEGKFPAKTYLLKSLLAERGYTAPDSLWGMIEISPVPDPPPFQHGGEMPRS